MSIYNIYHIYNIYNIYVSPVSPSRQCRLPPGLLRHGRWRSLDQELSLLLDTDNTSFRWDADMSGDELINIQFRQF